MRKQRLQLAGEPPSSLDPPSGRDFRTRCWNAQSICEPTEPHSRRGGTTLRTGW
jgi:ABC-type dipeptide/oligopeptide/nickel transport system ATPase component